MALKFIKGNTRAFVNKRTLAYLDEIPAIPASGGMKYEIGSYTGDGDESPRLINVTTLDRWICFILLGDTYKATGTLKRHASSPLILLNGCYSGYSIGESTATSDGITRAVFYDDGSTNKLIKYRLFSYETEVDKSFQAYNYLDKEYYYIIFGE